MSGEEGAEGLLDDSDGENLDVMTTRTNLANAVFRHEDALKAQSVGLGNALLHPAHRTHLSVESQLGGETVARRDGHIDIATEDSAGHGKIQGRVVHPQAAGQIEEHILGSQLEAAPLLENSQQHVHPA